MRLRELNNEAVTAHDAWRAAHARRKHGDQCDHVVWHHRWQMNRAQKEMRAIVEGGK